MCPVYTFASKERASAHLPSIFVVRRLLHAGLMSLAVLASSRVVQEEPLVDHPSCALVTLVVLRGVALMSDSCPFPLSWRFPLADEGHLSGHDYTEQSKRIIGVAVRNVMDKAILHC